MRQQPQDFAECRRRREFLRSSCVPFGFAAARASLRNVVNAFMNSRTGCAGEPNQRAPGGNVGHVPALRAQHRAGSDIHVIGNANLPAHHDEISHLRAAGNAGLPGDQAVPPDR